MPETLRTREYYLEKAEEHMFLHNAIAGEDPRFDHVITFEGSLEGILERLEEQSVSNYFKGADIREFHDYVTLVQELLKDTGTQLDASPLYKDAIALGTYGRYQARAAINGTVAALNGLTLLFPVIFPVSIFFMALNGYVCVENLRKAKAGKVIKDSKEEAFAPLYDAARSLDLDIGKCFLHEHFTWARSRFELTYRSLSGEERAEVKQELCRRLEAGALDMGEAELDRYLDGLRQQEAGHEGTILRRDVRYHDVHGLCAVEFDMTPEEFQEEKAAHIKAKGLRGRAPSEYMSIELEDLLCGFPDRLRIVKVFGRGKEADKQGEAYIEELREWHRNRDDEYLRELADILW